MVDSCLLLKKSLTQVQHVLKKSVFFVTIRGVLQESVLGPVFFALYNDVVSSLNDVGGNITHAHLCADDAFVDGMVDSV